MQAKGALDERDGERGGDGEEQAAEALVARPEAGGALDGIQERRARAVADRARAVADVVHA